MLFHHFQLNKHNKKKKLLIDPFLYLIQFIMNIIYDLIRKKLPKKNY